jgi:hypothetical protein
MALEELGLIDEQLLVNNPALLLSPDRDGDDAVGEPAICEVNRSTLVMILSRFTLPVQNPCRERLNTRFCFDRFTRGSKIIAGVCYVPVKTLEVQGRALGTWDLSALVALGALSSLNARRPMSTLSARSALNGLGALNALRTRWASRLRGLVVFVHIGRDCEEGQSLDSAPEVEN